MDETRRSVLRTRELLIHIRKIREKNGERIGLKLSEILCTRLIRICGEEMAGAFIPPEQNPDDLTGAIISL